VPVAVMANTDMILPMIVATDAARSGEKHFT
jgi:hypothetical protein